MFARTQRLTLRPGWAEDAPELARAIGHASVVRNLVRAPWPYSVTDAHAFIAAGFDRSDLCFLIVARDRTGCPIVGGIGIGAIGDRKHELGYWLTPDAQGCGYATEAGRAVLSIARTIGIDRVTAGHFVDNPASGAVLARLGFVDTGAVEQMHSLARGQAVPARCYTLGLASPATDRAAA